MLPLIFYYSRINRYSFNSLAAALDADAELGEMPIRLPKTPEELRTEVAAALDTNERIAVAFSVLTNQLVATKHLLNTLRARHGSRLIAMAGGPHVTADPQGALEAGFDVVFRGEGEEIFPVLLKRLAGEEEISDLSGVACRHRDQLSIGPRALPVDINSFTSFSPKRGMFGPIEMTRGCPFACSFCQTSHIFGARPRHRTIESIVRQATTLGPTKRKVVRLLSPNAFSYGSHDGRELNLPAVHALLQALRGALAPVDRIIFGYFPSEVRPEHVVPETLELLRRFADNDEIVIGAQSGSERMLETCHRSHTVEQALSAVRTARKFGLKIIVDFIFGLPGETEVDVRETVAVMMAVNRMGARIHPHIFAPLPQTAFAKTATAPIRREVLRALEDLRARGGLYEGQPRRAAVKISSTDSWRAR